MILCRMVLGGSPGVWAWVVLGLTTGIARPLFAAKTAQVVALVVISKEGSDREVVRAIDAVFVEIEKLVPGLDVVSGAALKKRLGTEPNAAMSACGADLRCIAKLGKRAGASRVVYARTIPAVGAAGVRTQFLVVGTKSRTIERKAMFELATSDEVHEKLAPQAFTLCGVSPPAAAPTAPPAPAPVAPSPILVAQVAPEPPVVASVAPEPEIIAAPPPKAEARSNKRGKKAVPELGLEPLPPKHPAPAVVAATAPLAPLAMAVASTPPTSTLTYVSAGSASLGLLAVGLGGYFGWHSGALLDSIKRGGGKGTTQLRGQALRTSAYREDDRANVMFIAGGALLALGAGLFGYEQLATTEPVLMPSVSADGVGATYRF